MATKAKEAKVSRAISTVEGALRNLNLPFSSRVLQDPFDYIGILRRFLSDLKSVRDRRVLFNITGGPKAMTVAATMACLLLGIPVVYVPEEETNARPVYLPIVRMRYTSLLTPKTLRILEILDRQLGLHTADFARELRLAHSTVDYHLAHLGRLGAIAWVSGGRRRPAISDVGRVLLDGLEEGGRAQDQIC